MAASAWLMLLRGQPCGSELVCMCVTLTHTKGLLKKPLVPLSFAFLHLSIQQILLECLGGAMPCPKCLGSLTEDPDPMELGSENSREEGPLSSSHVPWDP